MTALAVTNTLANGQTPDASLWNTNYSDIQTWLNNRYNGSDTWLYMKVSSTAANPVDISSSASTTELSINNSATDGDPILTWKLSGSQTHVLGPDDSDSDALCGGTTSITTNQWLRVPTVGAQIQVNPGTVSLPGVAIIGDTDSGLYWLSANDIGLATAGTLRLEIGLANVTYVDFTPNGAGSLNTGNGTNYWGDVSYKTLTDRGCLGWFDEGVELQDGRKVSDCDALASIQKHPTKKTIYGIPMLDYKTFPVVAYKKAAVNGNLLPRDENDEPVGGSDGVEMTSMHSIMIGAIKELHARVAVLEK